MRELHALLQLLPTQGDLTAIPLTTDDIVELAIFGGGVLLFVVLAVLFVVRSRRKRIAELTEALEDRGPIPLEDRERDGLPEPSPEPTPLAPEGEPEAEPAAAAPEVEFSFEEAPAAEAAEPELEPPRAEEPEAQKPGVPAAEQEQESPEQRQAALTVGLSKTRKGFIGRLSGLFGTKRELDTSLLEELEQILLTSDIGVQTADHLLELVRTKIDKKEIDQADKVRDTLKAEMQRILSIPVEPLQPAGRQPYVLMVVGVNGGGKTTTVGKLAARFVADGHRVVLGAGDTFRAAATEQLGVWAERAGAEMVRGKEGVDRSSVLFDAVKQASDSGARVVIADTAGRLHTKVNLMTELSKVHRVLDKASAGAPHEVLLVLDATTGQNAIAQAKQFSEAVPITGVVLTKLDGTAKGGVIVGICQEFGLPVRFIGIGEKLEDLREFDAGEFVNALFAEG